MRCWPRVLTVRPHVASPWSSNAWTVGARVSQGTSGWRLAGGMLGSVPQTGEPPEASRRFDISVDRDLPAAGRHRLRSAAQELRLPGPPAASELTASEVRQLTAWVRAGTTPQRLVRRARLILGSAAGLGSRALARQERMSRTTVRRWLGRVATERGDGLQDQPRSGRPKALRPATRALVVALACERPADHMVPLRRYSLSELTVEVANRLSSEQVAPSRTAI